MAALSKAIFRMPGAFSAPFGDSGPVHCTRYAVLLIFLFFMICSPAKAAVDIPKEDTIHHGHADQ